MKVSGAPKGSLYYHFPNGKEQLASEAITRFGIIIAEKIHDNLYSELNVVKAFQKHIKSIASEFDDIDDLVTSDTTVPIGLIAAEIALLNEALRLKCLETYSNWELVFFERITKEGYSNEEAKIISITINALIEGGVTLCLTHKSSEPLNKIVQVIPLLFKQ